MLGYLNEVQLDRRPSGTDRAWITLIHLTTKPKIGNVFCQKLLDESAKCCSTFSKGEKTESFVDLTLTTPDLFQIIYIFIIKLIMKLKIYNLI